MLVQDRSGPKSPKPQVRNIPKLPTGRFSESKILDCSTWVSENLFKVTAIFLLIVTMASLFFLRNVGERWIVVSVSNYPLDSLHNLVKLKGWQVLAVGNSKTSTDWSLKGAIFLSLEEQSNLGFRVVDYLPYDSYVRKTVGYLFAIQHGAKRIFDADNRGDDLPQPPNHQSTIITFFFLFVRNVPRAAFGAAASISPLPEKSVPRIIGSRQGSVFSCTSRLDKHQETYLYKHRQVWVDGPLYLRDSKADLHVCSQYLRRGSSKYRSRLRLAQPKRQTMEAVAIRFLEIKTRGSIPVHEISGKCNAGVAVYGVIRSNENWVFLK
ncbi:hypothetical protein K1719_031955 [Acacia pycnantha]|nr:hypothetical protein K1719_031955 [Acacia pycnantha]